MLFVNIVSLYFLVMAVAAVYWAAHIHSLNGSSYAHFAVLLCCAVCFYILGYCMELNSSSMEQILFWNKIEYIGIPFVSALWLTVGLMYTGHFTRCKKTLTAAIYVIPFVTMALRFTNDYHHLYFASVRFANEYGRLLLVKTPGPWMYVQLFHSMLMILITLALLIRDSVKNDEQEKGKIILMIAASFFAVSGLLFTFAKPFGLYFDYMALFLPATCVMVIWAIFRYDFLETKSIARSRVFEASRDAILLINRYNRVIDYNRSADDLLRKLNIDISERYVTKLFTRFPDLLKSVNGANSSVVKLCVDTEEMYLEVSTKKIDGHGTSCDWIKTIRDVTEIYTLNENLKQQAMKDELSSLNNRRAFMQMGQELIVESDKNNQAVYLMMMDLDNFKRVNDLYGHQTGDQVIRNLGEILKSIFSTNLIARLGGEEFAVLLADFSDAEVRQKADNLLKNTAAHEYHHQGTAFHVTISIGIAKKSYSAQALDNLMHLADKALYKSKDRGRNRVTYDSYMQV